MHAVLLFRWAWSSKGKDNMISLHMVCTQLTSACKQPMTSWQGCTAYLQFLPRISCLGYSVSSMKPSDAKTMGQSGKLGSQMTKFCWILSTVVARSRATRGNAFGAVMRLPITLRCFSSASCGQTQNSAGDHLPARCHRARHASSCMLTCLAHKAQCVLTTYYAGGAIMAQKLPAETVSKKIQRMT